MDLVFILKRVKGLLYLFHVFDLKSLIQAKNMFFMTFAFNRLSLIRTRNLAIAGRSR